MSIEEFDRSQLLMRSLRDRVNRVDIERDHVPAEGSTGSLSKEARAILDETAGRLCRAKKEGGARVLAFGAHAIKNGLAPVLIRLMEKGWLTHLATNGAGIIHDWEFAFIGKSSEHVAKNVGEGTFGAWEETGFYLNLALVIGAYEGLGYGESIGALVENEGLTIPSAGQLNEEMRSTEKPSEIAAAADLLDVVLAFELKEGRLSVPHPYKKYSVQAAAYRMGIPFTGHPMIGHDIIYLHPMNRGAAIGRTAERDFLRYAASIANLEGGVYLSVGSAVMSPMIFEKSLSMAQNVAARQGSPIRNHFIVVVDLAPSTWDWSQGEPPEDHPDYYQRFNKTFSRMGGAMRYLTLDNKAFLTGLLNTLEGDA